MKSEERTLYQVKGLIAGTRHTFALCETCQIPFYDTVMTFDKSFAHERLTNVQKQYPHARLFVAVVHDGETVAPDRKLRLEAIVPPAYLREVTI